MTVSPAARGRSFDVGGKEIGIWVNRGFTEEQD